MDFQHFVHSVTLALLVFFFFSFEYNCVYIYLTVQSVLVYCSASSPSSVHLCCAWTITCYMVVSAGSAFYTGPQVNFLLGSQPGECVIVEEITWTNRWTFLSLFFFFEMPIRLWTESNLDQPELSLLWGVRPRSNLLDILCHPEKSKTKTWQERTLVKMCKRK